MFLNKLEEDEKIAFLKLAHYIARSDDDFTENEQETISTYCMEMQVEDIVYDKDNFNLNDTLEVIKSKENQKIVLLEIMALIFSDGLHKEEQRILNVIIKKYNIDKILILVYAEWSKAILSIVNQGQALIQL